MAKMTVFQRGFALLGIVSFLGSTAFATVRLFREALTESETQAISTPTVPANPLLIQEQGYEKVVQREPHNQVALEGLVNIRLRLNKSQAALEPLETLIKLHPQRPDYQALREQLKQQAKQPPAKSE